VIVTSVNFFPLQFKQSEALSIFFECGIMIEDLANIAEPSNGSPKLPVIAIIEHQMLARSCIVNVLKRELNGFEIMELVSTSALNGLAGRDIRLIAFNIADKEITDPSIADRLALIEEFCPNAYVALLSNREDEATASAAMQRGVHGFFPTSIAVEVAIAGLRLVLAGGVYRPLPVVKQGDATSLRAAAECASRPRLSAVHEDACVATILPERAMVDLTPREQHVLAALKLGLPNKLIAVRLNLSENTVKMHIQRIMRKCSARNRTEAVLRWSGRANGHLPASRVPSSS
jgi:DNA-binding NarL/FixJ family response regulator